VPRRDREPHRVRAHALVVVERERQPQVTVGVGALAEELVDVLVVAAEPERDRLDLLVDVADDRFVLRQPALTLVQWAGRRRRP